MNEAADIPTRIAAMTGAMTSAKLGAMLGFGKETLYRMAHNGTIPHIRIGSSVRFDPAITAKWVRERMNK